MTRTLALAILLLFAVSKAFAGTWTVPLPELDGTHESFARGSDNPRFIEFDVPLEIPANIVEIGSATMIATISRSALWFAPFGTPFETDCQPDFDDLRPTRELNVRLAVGANTFILACGWIEPASIQITDARTVFDVQRVVSDDVKSWSAIKARARAGRR